MALDWCHWIKHFLLSFTKSGNRRFSSWASWGPDMEIPLSMSVLYPWLYPWMHYLTVFAPFVGRKGCLRHDWSQETRSATTTTEVAERIALMEDGARWESGTTIFSSPTVVERRLKAHCGQSLTAGVLRQRKRMELCRFASGFCYSWT